MAACLGALGGLHGDLQGIYPKMRWAWPPAWPPAWPYKTINYNHTLIVCIQPFPTVPVPEWKYGSSVPMSSLTAVTDKYVASMEPKRKLQVNTMVLLE